MQEQIIKSLRLESATGRLYWRIPPKYHPQRANQEAGCLAIKANGARWYVRVGGKLIPRARIVYFLHYKKWPTGVVDHINRSPLDDRPENLRDVSMLINTHNHSRANIRKLSSGRYQVRLGQKAIGTFYPYENAVMAYALVRIGLWGT